MFGFVYRDTKVGGLVYNGDIKTIEYCFDSTEALRRWRSKPNHINIRVDKFFIYGKDYEFSIPIYEADEDVKVYTSAMMEYVTKYAKLRLVSDITLGIWQSITKEYDIISVGGFFCFKKKDGTIVERTITNDAAILLMKEYLDGYVRNAPYTLKDKSGSRELSLHHNYTVDGIQIQNNYTAKLREAMFGATKTKLKRDKYLMSRQYDVLINSGRITYFAASRRSGKTFLLSFIAIREMLRNIYTMQTSMRPVNIIYIGLTRTKNLKVLNYIRAMAKNLGENMFHRDAANQIFSFRQGKDILGEISFVSCESKDPGVGDYADLIIIDEAGKVSREIFEGIEPIVYTEGAKLVCASTLYKDSNKGWFFEKLIQAEQISALYDTKAHIEKEYKTYDLSTNLGQGDYNAANQKRLDDHKEVGLRYTIEDIEYISDSERKYMKDKYKDNMIRYMSELYSRFPEEGKVFDYEIALIQADRILDKSYMHIVLAYDPAMTVDNPAVLVLGYNDGIKKIVVLEEHQLSKSGTYGHHAQEIAKIRDDSAKKYAINEKNVYVVVDATQKASSDILEMQGVIVNLRINYKGGTVDNKSKEHWNERVVGKQLLVDISEQLFEQDKILINMELTGLRKEMDMFQRIVDDYSGRVKYEGINRAKDDRVNAMMCANYFLYENIGLKYDLISSIGLENKKQNNRKEEMAQHWINVGLQKQIQDKVAQAREAREKYFRNHVY